MGTQLPSLKKAQPPIFCPCPLWSNGCIDYDATWYGGLVPSDIVRWRPYCPQRGHSTPNFRPMPIVGKRLDGSRCHLVWRQASVQATLCYTWGPSSVRTERSTAAPMSMLVVQDSCLMRRCWLHNLPSCACCTDVGRPASVNRGPCVLWRRVPHLSCCWALVSL